MALLTVVLISFACIGTGYVFYGKFLSRLLQLDPHKITPAVEMQDDVDYIPIEPKFLLSQHLSAIAAAGPIVGPILAGVMFGWLPALLWIIIGSIFIGGVHDFTALIASIRHKAKSIAEVVREHISARSYVFFLVYVWLALIYIVVAFTDITASSFVGSIKLENGQDILGGAIATSSLLYLALPILMGLLLRYTKISLNLATIIFLPLVGLAIWIGQFIPLDLSAIFNVDNNTAHKIWDIALLFYCFFASIIPMWILLQPRGHLGGYFLYIALAGGTLGLIFSGKTIQYPAFNQWSTPEGATLFPILFITIACGACSGFHAIICSGTTSKQIKCETDTKIVGYGAMLLEGMVAIISLCCVMILTKNSPLLKNPQPNFIYALGIGNFMEVIGIPATLGISFGLMAFTTFVYDTLDVCTRLGRYILQEFMGWEDTKGRWIATAITASVPLIFVMRTTLDSNGKPIPVWKTFWTLFGASNQLLAAITLLTITVWLIKTQKSKIFWLITGLPALWMFTMSIWALIIMIKKNFIVAGGFQLSADPVSWVALILVSLALLMLFEALKIFIIHFFYSDAGVQ